MRHLTGQDALVRAVDQLAGHSARGPRYSEAVRALRLRELRPDVDALGEQVGRWYRGEVATPADVALRALDVLGAINWDVLDGLRSPDAVRDALQAAHDRTAYLESLLDDSRETPSADPGRL